MDSQTAALIPPDINGLSHQERAQTWQQDDPTKRIVLIRHANDHWQVIGDLPHALSDGAPGGDQTRFTGEEIKTGLADWSRDKNIAIDYFPATSINPQQLRSELFDDNAIYASIEIKSRAGLRGGEYPQRAVSLQQTDVRKFLHFIWLGKLEAIQQDYITVWQKINPDYEIKIWYDSTALLAHELDKQIKSFVARELIVGEEAYLQRVTELKNQAHQAISQTMEREDKTFDQAAIEFMVRHLDGSAEDLARIKTEKQDAYTRFIAQQKDAASDYRLEDIYSPTDSFIERKYYYRELALGQDLTAAFNIARLNILSQQGGVYLDADLLPALKPLLPDPNLANIADINLVKAQLVTEYLTKTGKFPHHQRTVKTGEHDYARDFSARSPEHKVWVEQLRAAINPVKMSKTTRSLNDFFQPLGQLSINHNGLRVAKNNGTVSNAGMVAPAGSNMLKAVCQHINDNYRRQVNMDRDIALDARNGSIAVKQGMEEFARQRSGLFMDFTDAEWFFEEFDPYSKEVKRHSQVRQRIDHRPVFTHDQLSLRLKDIPVLTRLIRLQPMQDQLHRTTGVKQVEIAFRLQEEIRRLLQDPNQIPYPLYSQVLTELNQQINHMLFSQPLPGKAYIIDIARQRPSLAAQLYKTAFNEAQGYHPGLTDFLCFWINEDPYLKPLIGSTIEATPMPFEVTFRIPLGESFAQVQAALLQAQASNVMMRAELDQKTKVLSLGYSYQDLSDLATGDAPAAMVFTYLKEIAERLNAHYSDAPFDQLMLNQFADREYLHRLQDTRLAQATRMYYHSRNMDFDTWDRQYSKQGTAALNQGLRNLAFSEQLALLLQDRPGLLMGEEGDTITGQRVVIAQIDSLKQRGITTLGLGYLRHDRYQPLIDEYLGSTAPMSGELKAILAGKSVDITTNGIKKKSLILLFEIARAKGMKILALGDNNMVRPETENGHIWQAVAANSRVVDILKALPEGEKFVVIHDSRYLTSQQGIDRFIPGLAQRLGLPALAFNANQLQVIADEDANRPLFTLLDSIIEQKQQTSHNHWSQWYAMASKENIAYKMAVLRHLDALQQETFSVLTAEYLQMSDNPHSLDQRITALSNAIKGTENNISQDGGSQKDKDYLSTLQDMRTMYQQHKKRETDYEDHWETSRNDLLVGGIKTNNTGKLTELNRKIATLEGQIADLNILQVFYKRQTSVEPPQQNVRMPHPPLVRQGSTPWSFGASRQVSVLQRQHSVPSGKEVNLIIPADFLLRRLFTQGQPSILTAKLLRYQQLSPQLAAYKDIKEKYQDEMTKSGDIDSDINGATLHLPSDGKLTRTNISLLQMEEKPGWIRMYISLVDANYDSSQKELYLRNNKIIVQPRKAGGDINFSFGTTYRSLAWHQQYRLSPNIKHGPVHAPIRSVLVKTDFIRDFFGTFMESEHSERHAMQIQFVKESETVKLVSVDQRHPNQAGLTVDLKSNFQELLNQHADVSSFTTIASRSYQQSFYHADRDGEFYDIREIQHAIGLGDEQYLLPFSWQNKSELDMATAFNRIMTRGNKIEVGHLSQRELVLLYEQNSAFFNKLEQVRNGSASLAAWYLDPIQNQAFRDQLTHLLEINYLTPARLLENSQVPLWGSQRDVNGNPWLKAQWEGDFAQSYLTDEAAQQAVDQLMEKFADQLAQDEWAVRGTPKTEEMWQEQKESIKNSEMQKSKTEAEAEAEARANIKMKRFRAADKKRTEEAIRKSLLTKILQVDYVRSDLARLRQKLLQVWNNVTDSELLQKLLRNELHINGTWAELRSLRQQIFFHALRPAAQYYQSKRPVKSPEGLKVNTREERQAPWFILNSDDIDGMKITDDKLKSRNWYRPDQSEMSAFMADLDTPFSGGISGTTRDVTLQLTNLFGPLNVREYWTLQLFNAAQMINNGYHSFFEALYVAAFLEDRFVDQQQCIGKQLRDTFDALRQRAKRGEILNGQLYEQTLALILPKLDNSVAARYLPPEYGRQHHLLATESNRFRDLMSIGQLHRRVWVFSRQKEPDCNDILQALDRLRVTSGREGIEMAFILQNQLRNHQMWYPDSGSNPAFKELDQQIEQRLFSTTRITAADRANLVQIAEQQPTLAAELYYKLDQAQDSLPEFAELPDGLLIESHVAKEQGTVNKIKSGLQEIQQPANDDKRAREVDATKAKGEHTSSLLTPEEKQAIKNRGYLNVRYCH
ncbi:hypothetical protein CCS41_08165 [Candidatus Fukatsuia symbiotica]|uniref:Uncharacterized protein n=1 Tax=Candidatus Fukatsuia symbiotica TaxID=1878942 RepID=A0A2U8I5M8_9GAMM|nr:TcdA/TcdB catalytic glycosyltransferase domain-containing protein [Candidatus Fukatsuia symbiotica]AWK14456.1 hypothetical protein CCS41_08165 [Candidatus Fukatsuia symbiotica]